MTITEINKNNFEAEVLLSTKPVLVDFWASWCAPCRILSPIVEEIASELQGIAKIGKINVDEEPSLAQAYGVMSIPTLLLFKEGKLAATSVGVKPKEEIRKLFDA